jgi:phospholipase/carboxylesterase
MVNESSRLTRREFIAAAAASAVLASCQDVNEPPRNTLESATLKTRPSAPSAGIAAGWQRLNLASGPDGFLYVPPSYSADTPAPLMVLLHGAGGNGASWQGAAPLLADAGGFVILAPDSAGRSWDRIIGNFGPDVRFIDFALKYVFEHCNIDPTHLALGGFSDGATYALSLGIPNGDLFTHLMAFSPGFNAAPGRRETPRVFVSHGISDPVLPIDVCSRRIVPELRAAGYDVTYREFDGGHELPAAVADEAMQWFVPTSAPGLARTAVTRS